MKDGIHPYIAREFYGVWGDYDVTIDIDKDYKLGSTSVFVKCQRKSAGVMMQEHTWIKNPFPKKKKLAFVGNNVHDFMWAADPDYKHVVRKMPNNGTVPARAVQP